ncbi:hypothetical protein LZ198_39150 [Myxococcus sp. K15C18031901]|uniref:hypothetical protein n=1 Tax=Myxococcus dinghuensis TaxID=2906761 RepID=UPI0020A76CEA|nr:hypothetical protein [Myxococcus dinghuensis]MCP3104901.1 hypothetical protein [Myxococcus dinghuensis]
MALTKKGEHSYGDSRADLRPLLEQYSRENAYPVETMASLACECGVDVLELLVDDDAGVAVQSCPACEKQQPLGDSAEYLDEADPDVCECLCGEERFEISTGAAYYSDRTTVRWFYVACRCVACGLVGCYGDWKTP